VALGIVFQMAKNSIENMFVGLISNVRRCGLNQAMDGPMS